jgi:NADH:ubiquinone oxidoreductase subunit E
MDELQTFVKMLAEKHGNRRESLLPMLQALAERYRHVSGEAMVEVARELDLSTAEVYGTATFYSFLDTTRRGKYIIRICKTIVCDMHGKNQIVKTLEEQLKIKVGETTHNHKFSLLETNCLGWCHKGPAMLINDEVYTDLTPERIRQIIADYRNR